MLLNTLNFLTGGAFSVSTALEGFSSTLSSLANSITPAGLTDEYWLTDASITRGNEFFGLISSKTHYYHLNKDEEVKFLEALKVTKNETKAMQMMFRYEYENSYSYTIDKVLQLPAHLLSFGAIVANGGSYMAYAAGKGLEYQISFLESLEATMAKASSYIAYAADKSLEYKSSVLEGFESAKASGADFMTYASDKGLEYQASFLEGVEVVKIASVDFISYVADKGLEYQASFLEYTESLFAKDEIGEMQYGKQDLVEFFQPEILLPELVHGSVVMLCQASAI